MFEEADIVALVRAFYARVREDELLAPVFSTKIGPDDWERHMLHIADFWSSVMLKTGRFSGNPLRKHFALSGLTPEHFERWLDLFRFTAQEVLTPQQSQAITQMAYRIGQSFQMGLAFNASREAGQDNPFAAYSPVPRDYAH